MMTADAEEGSSGIVDDLFCADDDCDDVYLDLDSFWRVMGPPTSPSQGLEDLSSIDVPQEVPGSSVLSPSHNSEASDSRTGSSDGISESAGTSSVIMGAGMLEPSSHYGIVEHSCSGTVTDCISDQDNGLPYSCMVGGPQTPSSYSQNDGSGAPLMSNLSDPLCSYGTSHVTYDGESSADIHMNHDRDLFECTRPDLHFKKKEDASVIDVDRTSQDASHTESSSCEINTTGIVTAENGGMRFFGSNGPPYVSHRSGFQSLVCEGDRVVKGEDFSNDFISDYVDVSGSQLGHHKAECGSGSVSLNSQVGLSYSSDMSTMHGTSKDISPDSFSHIFSNRRGGIKVKKSVDSISSNEIISRASEVVDVISRKYYGGASELPSIEGIQRSSSTSFPISSKNYVSCIKNENEDFLLKNDSLSRGMVGQTYTQDLDTGFHDRNSAFLVSHQPGIWPVALVKKEMDFQKRENMVSEFNNFYRPKFPYQGLHSKTLKHINLDDDSDVYILEDMSSPAVASNPVASNGRLSAASQFSTSVDLTAEMVTGQSKLKSNNERDIFRVAMQDLSQPTSEALPPDGVLAVSLMKHQRIALSWMVNKETKGACCSGGILADDQGLGKTVSTIALILKERSPSSKEQIANMKQCQMEMCDLDEDNGVLETYYVEDSKVRCGKSNPQTKSRPPAGTLIVCPTSVLRQWSEELHNKVTREADLSVLIYHGSNRIKDPHELAKYDVVITTYAIVSMEVPKQPFVDESDDLYGDPYKVFSSNKKRKLLETASCKKSAKSKKSKKRIDNELFETISGPLAKVGWFRVVLDEAQTIKNHRTQVARACWGLRAKRRWCLSGTPIQNAIDDLYSYFRFLRHDPYATFKNFCDHIKSPIHRNPTVGYKKLQAVLKTIMLRRTKSTYIDGEPIINLPPKTIELKRVDFSMEERDFYCRLEADSQAQFAEYAKAGTVKLNYVNILLMLLRLRQACDHPLLVRGFNSTSQMSSSIEMAKKLPLETNICLLNCLEASLAICGICSVSIYCLCPRKICRNFLFGPSTKNLPLSILSNIPHWQTNFLTLFHSQLYTINTTYDHLLKPMPVKRWQIFRAWRGYNFISSAFMFLCVVSYDPCHLIAISFVGFLSLGT